MRRRAFIAGLGVSLAGSSLAAQAQTVKAPKIGVLSRSLTSRSEC